MRSATRKKLGKDRAYLAWLHTPPCVCCELLRMRLIEAGHADKDCKIQTAPTEAAHVGDRGLSQTCPDREAIPLCGVTTHMHGPASGHHREGPTVHVSSGICVAVDFGTLSVILATPTHKVILRNVSMITRKRSLNNPPPKQEEA